jgi:hypothetical protein
MQHPLPAQQLPLASKEMLCDMHLLVARQKDE